MTRVVVTGGSGKAGRACVRDLLAHGYEVASVDLLPPAEPLCPFSRVDLTDFGLAAIRAPGLYPNAVTFAANTVSTYNVFEAARRLGVTDIVWASSETVLGLPFDTPPPYAPVDEACPARPESAYSLSKLLGEEMAKQFCRWDPRLKIVGLRLSNVMEPDDYARFPGFDAEARLRK